MKNYRIDNLQYCNWSEKIFKINRDARIDAVHVTIAYHENFKETIISKIPSARLGEPNDIANAVVFLCSNQSSYINGETLHVNGGMYMA